MQPTLFTTVLDELYGEREFFLVHRRIVDEGIAFNNRLQIPGTSLIFADSLDETLEHFFREGGEESMPLVFDGRVLMEPEYQFSLKGYEQFDSPGNHYLGVVVLYYQSDDLEAVQRLLD